MNRVALVGNLTADPELRYTGSGIPSRTSPSRLAPGLPGRRAAGSTDGFFRCVAWRTAAENATKSLGKG